MPMPDPRTLIGKKCTIMLNSGGFQVATVMKYDGIGLYVTVFENMRLYTYAEIKEVRVSQ